MFRFFIQAEVKVTKEEHIEKLVDSETRIILLYSTKDEANNIMEWAREHVKMSTPDQLSGLVQIQNFQL